MTVTRTAAIHQPNFFPWLGYFDKIARSDVFVFLDDVQFPKTGGVWTNRVKLMVAGEPKWLTASINRQYHGTLMINEMTFVHGSPWRSKMIKTLQSQYSKHPFYEQTMDILSPLLMNPESNISEYNIHAVTGLASVLGLDTTNFCRSSDYPSRDSSTRRLCSLACAVSADTYICGGGADGYQDDQIFSSYGLTLRYQNYSHPCYPQYGYQDFVPGLSIIDAIMNLGFRAISDMLKCPHI